MLKKREGGAEAERWRDFYMNFLIIEVVTFTKKCMNDLGMLNSNTHFCTHV